MCHPSIKPIKTYQHIPGPSCRGVAGGPSSGLGPPRTPTGRSKHIERRGRTRWFVESNLPGFAQLQLPQGQGRGHRVIGQWIHVLHYIIITIYDILMH